MNDEIFRERLCEAMAWCQGRVDIAKPGERLRSQQIKPQMIYDREEDAFAGALKAALDNYSKTGSFSVVDQSIMREEIEANRITGDPDVEEDWFAFSVGSGEISWVGMVESLAGLRREALKKEGKSGLDLESLLQKDRGALLFYEDDLSELDGKSQPPSRGFLNSCDVAPWDTWLAYLVKSPARHQALLVSWVPSALIPMVEEGIRHVPPACLWLMPTVDGLEQAEKQRDAFVATLAER